MDSIIIPARRRRHSGSSDSSTTALKSIGPNKLTVIPPPRPKSTPGERPAQRRRQKSPVRGSDNEDEQDEDADADASREMQTEVLVMQVDGDEHNKSQTTSSSLSLATTNNRPTRPLPSSKGRTMSSSLSAASKPYTPIQHIANPSMLPVQAHVARGPAAASQRKLYVILEQACLEVYKVSGGSKSIQGHRDRGGVRGRGKDSGEAKYTLLNCDDHQGILAKMGRDIADARPDITHQVNFLSFFLLFFFFFFFFPSFCRPSIYSSSMLRTFTHFFFRSKCLLTLLDSPLKKAGLLQVYIHTASGVLIEVNPHVRIPRTFKRFSGLMGSLSSYIYGGFLQLSFSFHFSPTPSQAFYQRRERPRKTTKSNQSKSILYLFSS